MQGQHFWSLNYDGTNLNVYRDCILVGTLNIGSIVIDGSSYPTFYLGRAVLSYINGLQTLDEFSIFNRTLSLPEIRGLYLAKSIPKLYAMADYRMDALDNDGVITPSEKINLLSRWKEIYNEINVSSVLTTSSPTKDGEYSSIVANAVSLSVNTDAYILATNNLRDFLWGASGVLKSMGVPSTVTAGALDNLFSTYRKEYRNLLGAISQQEAAGVYPNIPQYTPHYLGAHLDSSPATAKNGDWYLRYSATSGDAYRGVFVYDGSSWARTTEPVYLFNALYDIVFICAILGANGTTHVYGSESDYGITSTIQTAHIMSAIIDRLRVGDLVISGLLSSPIMDTIAAQAGETISNPTKTYFKGDDFLTYFSSLTNGLTAVDAASALGGNSVNGVLKGDGTNVYYYYADDTQYSTTSTSYVTLKTMTSNVNGAATIFVGVWVYLTNSYWRVLINGSVVWEHYRDGGWLVESNYNAGTFNLSVGDIITIQGRSVNGNSIYNGNTRIAAAVNTLGIKYSTGNYQVIENGKYYNLSGNVDLTGFANWQTSAQMLYWLGSSFINSFVGKVSQYKTIALGGGTFASKTCSTIYINGLISLTLTFTDSTSKEYLQSGYYSDIGSVILPTVEGKLLLGDPDAEGQYELWLHNIPGSTDNIITFRNRKSGKVFSILEARAPDNTSGSGSIESTFSLHNVYGSGDYVRDISMHNYSGTMKAVDVFSNFGSTGALGAWEWWKKLYSDASATKVASLDPNTGDFEVVGALKGSAATISGNASITGAEGVRTAGTRSYASFGGGSTTSASYVQVGTSYKFKRSGTFTFYFGLEISAKMERAYARIYKNGVAYGTERSTTNTTYVYYSENLTVISGDIFSIRIHSNNDAYTTTVTSVQIKQNEEGEV